MLTGFHNVDGFRKGADDFCLSTRRYSSLSEGEGGGGLTILVGPTKLYHVVRQDLGYAANFCRDDE